MSCERHAGVLVPLFSVASNAGWGIGEIADLSRLAGWLGASGFDRLMILPIGTMPAGESSPYSAISTMAIDPIYIAMAGVEDFTRMAGVRETIAPAVARDLDEARQSPRVRYDEVRRAKMAALEAAFDRFLAEEWEPRTDRACALDAYIARESWWLEDYARFQAIASAEGSSAWRSWPAPLRDRDPSAIAGIDRTLERAIRREQYLQWIAETQWRSARETLRASGVQIVGDLPFGLGIDSPEVWSRAGEFDLDVSVGVPPDAFSETGQDWRLPMYCWDVIARSDYDILRRRGRRMAALYDAFRLDHLVGYYRTFGRRATEDPFFSPAEEPAQQAQGERILAVLRAPGASVMAEDLGSVPDFVRESMARLGVPGCKVLRWEREWHAKGQPYLDPASFPQVSMAVTGTHDLDPLAHWWDAMTGDERAAAAAQSPILVRAGVGATTPWSDALRDLWLEVAYGAGSDDVFLPMQDVFGWRDRINTPATISDSNWTWKLPWNVDEWIDVPQTIERAAFCRALAARTGRGIGPS